MSRAAYRVASVIVLLAASSLAAAQPAKPLLWRVSDANNHVYLLGSFHALKADDYPLPAAVNAALADSEIVAFEISPAEMASPDLPKKMIAAATLPESRTLQQMLSDKGWHRLQLYAARRELPLVNFQHLEPWFVSLVVSLREMALLGYDPKQGLDQYLIARAAAEGKRTLGLETADQQIAALDSMSLVEQQQALAESLDEAQNFKAQIDHLHDLWRAGDESGLEQLLAAEFKRDYAQLYQRINVARNQAWLPKISKMLDGRETDDVLIVVGSLHLLGSDGLVSQLKSKGYRVERL